jgi:hypothetical protein
MTKRQSNVAQPARPANLPVAQRTAEWPEMRADPQDVFRRVCLKVLADPASTAGEKFRAIELFNSLKPQESKPECRFCSDLAEMSDERIAELLPDWMAPIDTVVPCEVERELERRRVELEREFEARVEERVRELVDVEAVEARIEERARELTAARPPLTLVGGEDAADAGEPLVRSRRPDVQAGWGPRRRRRGWLQ